MRGWHVRSWALLALACAVLPVQARAFNIDAVEPSVVFVYSEFSDGNAGQCTGFVIAPETVATNNHCVTEDPAGQTEVAYVGVVLGQSFEDGTLYDADILWRTHWHDLAILRVPGLDNPPIPLAIGELKQGEPVWAVGFPGVAELFADLQLVPKVSGGVVSYVGPGRHRQDEEAMRTMVQHDASIHKGNSGGPLINACNQVVAVNTYGLGVIQLAEDLGGEIPQGVNYGTHASVLGEHLRESLSSVTFLGVESSCVPELAGIDVGLPNEAIFGIVAAVVVAIAALSWSFYSHARLRYAIRDMGHSASRVVRSMSRSVRVDRGPSPRGGAPNSPPPLSAQQGWAMTGRDGEGVRVELRFRESEIQAAGDEGLVIGRQRSLSDLIVADASVSRRHAALHMAGSDIVLVDLNSKFGTSVDGRKLKPYGTPVRLREGTEVRIGDVAFTVRRG